MTSPSIFAKEPPHSKAEEASLIGAILQMPEEHAYIFDRVKVDDFYWDAHQKLFNAAKALYDKHEPVDPSSVYGVIRDMKEGENIGNSSYVAEICSDSLSMTSETVRWCIDRIKEYAARRQIIRICLGVISDVYNNRPIDEIIPEMEKLLEGIGANSDGTDILHVSEPLENEVQRILRMKSGEAIEPPIPTGIRGIDDILSGGFRRGVTAIGARPGSGKTSFGLQVCRNASVMCNVPSLFVSMEMGADELTQRHMAALSGMDLRQYRDGCQYWTASDDVSFDKAHTQLGQSPMYIVDTSDLSVSKLSSLIRRAVKKFGIKIVVVDYLGLMQPEPEMRQSSRYEQMTYMTRQIKNISRRHAIPILELAQLNRGYEEKSKDGVRMRGDDSPKRPSLKDFRDSGSIEQDADNCFLMYCRYDSPGDSYAQIGCYVAKQRHGPCGVDVDLRFHKSTTSFCDPENMR